MLCACVYLFQHNLCARLYNITYVATYLCSHMKFYIYSYLLYSSELYTYIALYAFIINKHMCELKYCNMYYVCISILNQIICSAIYVRTHTYIYVSIYTAMHGQLLGHVCIST